MGRCNRVSYGLSCRCYFEFYEKEFNGKKYCCLHLYLQRCREGNYKYYGSKKIASLVSKYGEPYNFGIPEGGINKFLKKLGFRVIKNYTPEELEKVYLTFGNGKSFGKIASHQCAVIAKVL